MNGRGDNVKNVEGEIPTIPVEPSEQVHCWIELEERGFITGYSSSQLNSQSVRYEMSELPEDFETHFSFYRLGEDLKLVYDRARVDEMIAEQEEEANKPTQKDKIELLERENDLLKQEVLETKQRAIMTEEALLDLATMIISI